MRALLIVLVIVVALWAWSQYASPSVAVPETPPALNRALTAPPQGAEDQPPIIVAANHPGGDVHPDEPPQATLPPTGTPPASVSQPAPGASLPSPIARGPAAYVQAPPAAPSKPGTLSPVSSRVPGPTGPGPAARGFVGLIDPSLPLAQKQAYAKHEAAVARDPLPTAEPVVFNGPPWTPPIPPYVCSPVASAAIRGLPPGRWTLAEQSAALQTQQALANKSFAAWMKAHPKPAPPKKSKGGGSGATKPVHAIKTDTGSGHDDG